MPSLLLENLCLDSYAKEHSRTKALAFIQDTSYADVFLEGEKKNEVLQETLLITDHPGMLCIFRASCPAIYDPIILTMLSGERYMPD